MTFSRLACPLFASLLSVSVLPVALPVAAQQQPAAVSTPAPSSQQIELDVVVDTKFGDPITNLRQQDFIILDNKSQRPINSFKIVTAKQEPVEVIVVIDAVNMPYETVSFAHDQTKRFLKANEGTLAHPTTIAILTDQGVKIASGFSTNGKSLSNTLQHYTIGLRSITRASQWGGLERINICLSDLHQLVAYASTLPGRKLLLYVSPGWPFLSGDSDFLDSSQQHHIFDSVVDLSSQLRQAKITLYDMNPFGASESMMRADYYKSFLKGLSKLSDARYAYLGLQVLAVQSGGRTLTSDNDVSGNIQKCVTDANSWYEITFDPPPADKPNEYHAIEVKLDQPGLIARTRTGYYANPVAANAAH